jgi:hypothetical protein
MPVTTWWGLLATVIILAGGASIFVRRIVYGDVKSLRDFRRLALWTALVATILVVFSAFPFDFFFPCPDGNKECNAKWRDVAIAANAIGPLVLSVSVTLASIFYSAGEWYETAQRFRMLGILDAQPDRRGRQSARAHHWQDVLRGTKRRIVISGTTLGGWFVTGWEETRDSLLAVAKSRGSSLLGRPERPWLLSASRRSGRSKGGPKNRTGTSASKTGL